MSESGLTTDSTFTGHGHSSVAPYDLESERRFQHNYWISLVLILVAIVSFFFADAQLADPGFFAWMPGDAKKFIGLSETFAHGFGVLLIAMTVWFLAPEAIRYLPRIALCAFWPALIVQGIKIQFFRWRPIRFFDEFSVAHFPVDQTETWLGWWVQASINSDYVTQSFPSGHAATAWGLAIGMTYAFPKGKWLFVFLALLASIQRVMVYAHWPSDVLVGAAVAFCFAGALTQNWGVGRWLDYWESRFGPCR